MKWKDKTRGGHPVRIYAEDGAGVFPIHGATYRDKGWKLECWMMNGKCSHDGALADRDLIPTVPIIDWSKQPDWCKAVARGKSGRWWRYDSAPHLSASGLDPTGHFTQLMHPSEYPAFDGKWEDSLCVRPEGGAK